MKKSISIILIFILIIICGITIIKELSNPMRKSESEIRKQVIELIPIGSSKESVIKAIEKNSQLYKKHKNYEWFYKYKQFNYGFAIKNGMAVLRHHGYWYDDAEMIGRETIEVAIGRYSPFFEVVVFAYLAFDENGNLADIGIHKSSDGF